MVMDIAIQSEEPSLNALGQALEAIKKETDEDALAILLFTVTELYADSQCRCEKKADVYGEGTAESEACYWDVDRSREKMLEAFRIVAGNLKRKEG